MDITLKTSYKQQEETMSPLVRKSVRGRGV
jgi:hypothetical protein